MRFFSQGIILAKLVNTENPVLVMPVRLDNHMLVLKRDNDMSILPDKRREKRTILIVAILAALAIPLVVQYREANRNASSDISAQKKQSLPVYFPSGEVKYYSRGDSVSGVYYQTKLPYSKQAAEILLEFYDKKMKDLGLQPFVEDYYKYADRKWSTPFIDATAKGNPNIVQLNASWVDEAKSKRANLNLRYYWYVDNSQSTVTLGFNDDLKVDYQIMPFMVLPPPTKTKN